MQISLKATAFALVLGAASTSAFAGSVSIGSTPSSPGTLTLAIFNEGGNTTTLVNLNQPVSNLTTAGPGGAFTPNSPTGAFTLATDPTNSANQVLQIDYGTIPLDASLTSNVRYMVVGAQGATTSIISGPSQGTGAASTANGYINTLVANLGNASGLSGGVQTDTTGGANWNLKTVVGSVTGGAYGALGTGGDYSASIGSALSMFLYTGSGRTAAAAQYANGTGNGFWYLSSTGNLTWNVPVSGTAPVPLPAAAWLLMSGLAGLGAVGRRRKAA